MRRYWIDTIPSEIIELTGEVFHHICEVCRQDEGSRFELLAENSKAYFVELIRREKRKGVCRVLEERIIPALPRPHLHLCLSLPKFSTWEAVVEKAVELGVYSVRPFFSDYSFVKTLDKISSTKWERWQKIIRSATQQTGRGQLMEMGVPVILEDLFLEINPNEGKYGLFPYEGESSLSVSSALKSLVKQSQANEGIGVQDIYCFVGSEGGFSIQEVEYFKKRGLYPSSLGSQILRVETACVALVSIIKYEMGLF